MIIRNKIVDKTSNEKPRSKTMSLDEQIESIKSNLYKKIDVCFMKYGLRGLKKIDESIADGLVDFVAEEEGTSPRRDIPKQMANRTVGRKNRVAEQSNPMLNNPILAMASEVDLTGQATHKAPQMSEMSIPNEQVMMEENNPALYIPTEADLIPVDEQEIEDPGINDMVEVDPDDVNMGMPQDNAPVDMDDFGGFDLGSIGAALQ